MVTYFQFFYEAALRNFQDVCLIMRRQTVTGRQYFLGIAIQSLVTDGTDWRLNQIDDHLIAFSKRTMFYVGLSARAGFEVTAATTTRFYGDNMSLAARHCIALSGKRSEFVSEAGHARQDIGGGRQTAGGYR